MKILKFLYHMDIQFNMPVREHHFTLKCLPHSGQGQIIESVTYQVYPNRFISRSTDPYFNETIYGYCHEEHDHFTVDVEGIARTGISSYIEVADKLRETAARMELSRMDPAARAHADIPALAGLEDPPKGIFKYQTKITVPDGELCAYHDDLESRLAGCSERISDDDRAHFYMHHLFEDFAYESGATGIGTTAADAFHLKKGVCQDYTHILLSLLRMEHIPCRYVTGMMEGEGLSHAWVEYFCGDGWTALDPTNDQTVTDGHISISRGCDYRDCMLNQGIFVGCGGKAEQVQTIHVEVRQIG